MISIDPRTGKILQKFDLDNVDDSLFVAQNLPRSQTIFLGRHEYKVAIIDSNQKWWNITYSEYVPDRLDWRLPVSNIPMDIYIAPDAARAVTGIDVKTGDIIWTLDLPYPIVGVFDVFHRKDYTVALSKQDPPNSLDKGKIGQMLSLMNRRNGLTTAYVGVHEGSLYALSTKNYPLVQISKWASMYTGRKPGDTNPLIEGDVSSSSDQNGSWTEWLQKPHPLCCRDCEYHIDCMIGQHVVQNALPEKASLPENRLMLEPPKQITPDIRKIVPGYASLPEYKEKKTGFFYDGAGKFWQSYILGMMVLIYVYRDTIVSFYTSKILPKWKQWMRRRAKAKKNRDRINAAAKVEQDKINRELEQERERERKVEEERERERLELKKKENAKQEKVKAVKITATTRAQQETPVVAAVAPTPKTTGLDLENFQQSKSRVLQISEKVLGYGSHGTVVYKGKFDGRDVAVKRLLLDFYDVALKEVKLLQESDDHPNVVRYFYKEESDRFLYIALELCYGSLNAYMERTMPVADLKLFDTMNPAHILSQFTCGLQYLHSLKIVHRDIKPHNILLAPSKQGITKDAAVMRILISDFGLCKKLDGEQSSFNYTAASPAGTTGWRAPELLAGALAVTSSDTSSTPSSGDPNMVGRVKATRAIDIFSAGCVFYYVLSGGDHPFGNRFGREHNILNGVYDLEKLDAMGEDGVEAKDLVERMLSNNPKSRPTSDTILGHPFFWTTTQRLAFLQDASDRFEIEERDPPSPLLQTLEADAMTVIGKDWYKRIDRVVVNDLGRYRKYDGKRVRDLLRALRNKKHHWQDLPEAVKRVYGEPPDQFLYYFTARFPHLFLHTYYVVAKDPLLRSESAL
ncbi:kinase-like protein, partial [Backusella circina FSU 941]